MHGTLQWKGFLVAAGATELGLGTADFLLDATLSGPGEPCMTRLDDTRFDSFGAVERELRRRAGAAIVCEYLPDLVTYGGVSYEKDGPLSCREWSFRRQQPFTIISFLESRSTQKLPPWVEELPPQIPLHLSWLIAYLPAGTSIDATESCYTGTIAAACSSNASYAFLYCTGRHTKFPVLRRRHGDEFVVDKVVKKLFSYWTAYDPLICMYDQEGCSLTPEVRPPSLKYRMPKRLCRDCSSTTAS
jgi:hypothetical protein